jgi:hypothetical protein
MTAPIAPGYVLHLIAQLVRSDSHLNGSTPPDLAPWWRKLTDDLGHLPQPQRPGALKQYLEAIGLSPAQIIAFNEQLAGIDTDKPQPGERQAVQVLTRAELRNMPKPEPLIADHLQRRSLAVLYGPAGVGKSVLALSMACSVASGQAWFGKAVYHGPVVYIAGEGADDLDNRLTA